MANSKIAKRSKRLIIRRVVQFLQLFICTAILCYLIADSNLSSKHLYAPSSPNDQDTPVEPLDPSGYLDMLTATDFRPGNSTPPSAYANLPVSHYRPSGQFATQPTHMVAPAVITILTVTYNPRHYIFRVARFVQEQSLQAYRWLIVNDHTDDPVALQRLNKLDELAKRDWRVRIISNSGPRGGPSAMNFGIQYVRTPFVAILDDDDLWELTTLEKAALVMSWVPSAYAVGFDVINHGAKEFLWTRGFYNGDENYHFENGLVQGSPLRTAVFDKCKFSAKFSGGAADWDLWMCMASQGMWGIHIPENGTWYQVNPASFRKKRWANLASAGNLADTQKRIMAKYADILNKEEAWPTVLPLALNASYVAWGPTPFENRVAPTAPKRLLIILTSLQRTALVYEMLRYIHNLAEDGWRTTVLVVHRKEANADTKDMFMQYTHDIFVAPLVAPVNHVPQLLNYLIESRQINTVIIARSKLGYALLPGLAFYAPDVKLIDYVPDCSATSNVVAQESVKMDKYLDLTFVPTPATFKCVVDHGKSADKLVIARGYLKSCDCGLIDQAERSAGKAKLGMTPDQMLILVTPQNNNATAALLMESLIAVLRDRMLHNRTAMEDGIRVFWPGAPLERILASDDIVRAWIRAPGLEHDAERLADVVIIANSMPHVNPTMYGCRGARVLTDIQILPDEPAWEWGQGDISFVPPLTSDAGITQYARHIEDALSMAGGDKSRAFQPASEGARSLLESGKVACPFTEALRRAHERERSSTSPSNTDICGVTRTMVQAIADESATWPSLFDMRSIQMALQYRKRRTGYGRKLQLKCPERIYRNTEWIDSLEIIKACDGQGIDGPGLQRAAFGQCGAWCVANIDFSSSDPNPLGWSLHSSCWSNVSSPEHQCSSHIRSMLQQFRGTASTPSISTR